MLKKSINRLLLGIGANIFGQIITIFTTIIYIPLFIHFWGIELLGEWQMLVAIPAYLTLSNLGFIQVTGNEMIFSVSQNDKKKALEIFQSIWFLITVISLFMFMILILFVWILPLNSIFNIIHITSNDIKSIILLMIIYVLLGIQLQHLDAGFRCEGNYALWIYCNNILRLFEFFLVIIFVYRGSAPLYIAIVYLITRSVGFLLIRHVLKIKSNWITYGFKNIKITTIKRLFKPSMAFIAYPVSELLRLQSTILIIGSVLGSPSVVIFTTLRKLTNFSYQMIGIIKQSVWPELSFSFAAGKLEITKKLYNYSCQFSLWILIILTFFLLIFGNMILNIWTEGKIEMDYPLFILLLAGVIARSLWNICIVVMKATNKHQKILFLYLLFTFFSIGLSFSLIHEFSLSGPAFSLLLLDIIMLCFTVKISLALLNQKFSTFLLFVIKPPVKIFKLKM